MIFRIDLISVASDITIKSGKAINDDCGDDYLDDMVFDDFDVGDNEEDQDNDLFAASPCSL